MSRQRPRLFRNHPRGLRSAASALTILMSAVQTSACLDNVGQGAMVQRVRTSLGRATMATPFPRSEKLDLRLTADAKQTLRAAAAAACRTLSDFVLESAMSRAAETLADRQRFGLDARKWEAFQAALEAPTRSMPQMRRLLAKPSVFEGE